jgi:hypothetical protein
MKKLSMATLGVMLTVAVAFGALASVATAKAKPPPTSTVSVPITGTVDPADGGGSVAGTFTIARFVNDGGQLAAVGTVTGTVTDLFGNVVGTDTVRNVTMPVDSADVSAAQAVGSCEILDLVLGPLDLDLLGLVVHLDQVHLNITAEQGPGNLLGNLLCAVAGLLDNTGGGGPLNAIVALLNQILGILNGL